MVFVDIMTLLRLERTEYILDSGARSYAFTVTHDDLWDLYQRAFECFWSPKEVDPCRDAGNFARLTSDERHFIGCVLAFFATADSIVFDNLDVNFSAEVSLTEAKHFYAFQGAMENVHSETYMKILRAYVADPREQVRLINAMHDVDSIRDKAEWAKRYFDTKHVPFALRLIAFAVVEGVFFSSAFAAIFWLKKHKKEVQLDALTFSNQLISRDEGLHCDFAVALFHKLRHRPLQADVHELVRHAVQLEQRFMQEALPVRLIGMSDVAMARYVEFVADRLLTGLGYEKVYMAENPFLWMELISQRTTTNFFENKVAEYALCKEGTYGEDEEF